MNWEQKTLDQLGYVSRGRSRHRPRDAQHLYDGPYPFIQTSDVKHANLYITDYKQTYNEEGLAQSKLWPSGTLCITIAANIADTAILGIDACFPDSVIGFIPEKDKADARFIKYLFDALLQRRFKSFTQGAAQDNLSQSKLLSIKFPVPHINEQKRISEILSNYDELIINNYNRISILEKSVHLLYKEWFVHLRFPGCEHALITDGIPIGWEKVRVPDIIDINPKTIVPKDQENKYVDMAALTENSMVVSEIKSKKGNSGSKFTNGDTLFARITPCLENGKTGYVNFLSANETAIGSTEFIVLRPKRVPSEFVYCLSRTYNFRENAIKSMVGSSGRQRVQVSCFDEFILLIPSARIMDMFTEIVTPIFNQIKILTIQNQKLKQARDLLVLKLINGEISI
ncbi:restriction endonuclease subunit S [Metabacillus dongyingensis]|uniref:restriction endonuclease subunit S n=1 Tax=Metabacillus dongyingensis TaxID=2874282 RepID=UPI003B8AB6BA